MSKPNRALLIYFNGKSNAGGAERIVHYFDEWLQGRGVATEIIDESRLKNTWLGKLYWKLFNYRHFLKRKPIYMARFASAYCWWRKRPGQLYVSNGESTPYFPVNLVICQGCYHVMEKAYGRKEPGLSRIAKLQMRGIQKARQVVAVTAQVKNNLVKYYHIVPDKISIVANGLDTSFFPVLPKPAQPFKTILYAGRLENGKGLSVIIQLAECIERTNGWRLLIACNHAGNTVHFKSFKQTDIIVGLQQHNINEQAYSRADLVIFPSLFESFGMVTIEALSAGVPVLATPVGIIPQLLERNYPGVFGLKTFAGERILDECAAHILHFETTVDRHQLHKEIEDEFGMVAYRRRLDEVVGKQLNLAISNA